MPTKKPYSGRNLKSLIFTGIQISISVPLLIWAFWYLDLKYARDSLINGNHFYLLVAFVLSILQAGIVSWRWQLINRAFNFFGGIYWHFRVIMICVFFMQVLPFSIGGDAYRIWALAQAEQGYTSGVLSVICDRIISIFSLMLLSALTIPIIFIYSGVSESFQSMAVYNIIGIAIFFIIIVIGRFANLNMLGRVFAVILAPINALVRVIRHPKQFFSQTLLAVLGHLCAVIIMLLIAWALRIELSLIYGLLILPTVLLVSALPISFAGWGVREGSMIAVFALLGLTADDAVLLSVSYGLMTLATGMVGAFFWVTSQFEG